eukprot:TRINITY_DN6736_c0_g2_i1.p1 TRINITY_DN6736_c0_g2~~TRINITY_DN6736_c0_g2_i1.p1  ORF type:complete len:3109 (+),score=610.88 TRINITY_DN6736_c0_g2_i1:49-9375(+)
MAASDEETVPEMETKRQRTNGGSLKAEIATLQRLKKEAVKSENYAEAMRLKGDIDRLTDSMQAAAVMSKEKTKSKRAREPESQPADTDDTSPPKKLAKPKGQVELTKPCVDELTCEPFFDDARGNRLNPHDLTSCEREAFRAVQIGNTQLLEEKLVGKVPLWLQRDVASRQTPLHAAMEKVDTQAMRILLKQASNWGDSDLRRSSLQEQGTGEMSVLTLGFATGKVGAARGGRELNNALIDPKEPPEPLDKAVARSPLTAEHIQLLYQYGVLTRMPMIRRGKLVKVNARRFGNQPRAPWVSVDACVEPAVMMGNFEVLKALLSLIDSAYGVTDTHRAAVGLTELSDKLQSRSILAKMRVGGELSPIHFAAINPDVSKLTTMLQREPSALTHQSASGLLPIHLAAACQGLEPLRLLLSEWQADRKVLGPERRTPLHFAAMAGRACNVRLLMGFTGGPAASHCFPTEIRALLGRQKGTPLKIANDSILLLSRVLTDLLSRVAQNACERTGHNKGSSSDGVVGNAVAVMQATSSPSPSAAALYAATLHVLQGAKLAQQIAETAKKVADGELKVALSAASSSAVAFHRQLSEVTDDALRQMFDQIDKNGDGSLDRAEVKEIFAKCEITMGKNALPRIFKAMDTDQSGDVCFDEFSAWIAAGSSWAKSLRAALVISTGDMKPAEIVQAETVEDELKDATKVVFSVQALMDMLGLVGGIDDAEAAVKCAFAGALLECVCAKILEVSGNAARSQKKTSVTPDHVLSSLGSNQELKGLCQQDGMVMNSCLLPMKDKQGYAAIHYAAEAGHVDALEALITCHADVDSVGPDRKTALSLAAEQGRTECVRALVAAGAKVELGDKRRRTPLLLAVRAGRAVVSSVLLHHGANPNAADDSGNTVCHYAAAFGWVDCVELLHRAGADLSAVNQMKLAPITAALQKGHRAVFRRMMELGIDVNFRDSDGNTLLLSCLTSMNRVVLDEVTFMLSKGADPGLASSCGTTALHKVSGAGLGSNPEKTAYAPHPFEKERLARLEGWKARPNPPKQADEEEEEEDESSDGDSKRTRQNIPEQNQAVTAEALSERIYERGFFQLTNDERNAVFKLGWSVPSWQAGHNPTMLWSQLDDAKREAAKTLGLSEETWWTMPVRFVAGVRGADGKFPLQQVWAVGHDAASDGEMIAVKFPGVEKNADDIIRSVHVSRLLLPEEDAEGKIEHVSAAVARRLLDAKAAPDCGDAKGTTPLMQALLHRKSDLAILLLERGANPNARENETKTEAADSKPVTTSQPMTPILAFATARPCSSDTFHFGTWSSSAVAKALISKGVDVVVGRHNERWPLIELIKNTSDFDSAQVLFDAGASPLADINGRNALHLTAGLVFKDCHAFNFAKRLLLHAVGRQLITDFSSHTAGEPQVTPLHCLLEAFASNQFVRLPLEKPEEQARRKTDMLLDILNTIPASADLSKWTRASESVSLQEDAERCSTARRPLIKSPLTLLCMAFPAPPQNCAQAVELLCQRGVNPDGDAGSPPPLHSLVESLSDLTSSSLVQILLGRTNLTTPMIGGNTMLINMLTKTRVSGLIGSVRLLLNGKCDVNQPGKLLERPLHFAARKRDEELIHVLLEFRADPNLANLAGRTPLHNAVMYAPDDSNANFDVEEQLLAAGADIAKTDLTQRSALHYAFMKGDVAHAFDSKSEDRWFKTATRDDGLAHHSWGPAATSWTRCRIDPIETVASLCAVKGVNVNGKDREGMTALHLAALRGSSISALKLVSAGAQLEEEFASNTALGLAIQKFPDTAVLLMQRGAKTTTKCVQFVPDDRSIQHSGKAESVFSVAIRCVSSLQQRNSAFATSYLGAAISTLDCGFPRSEALNDTISSGQYVMLLTLIPKVGTDALRTQRFDGGQNVFHRLAAAPLPRDAQQKVIMLKVAQKLLDRAVPLDADDQGATPLHIASERNFVELVSLILDHIGTSARQLVTAKDADGITALGRAFRGGDTTSIEVARLLIAHGASASQALVDGAKQRSVLIQCIILGFATQDEKTKQAWPSLLFGAELPDVLLQDCDGLSCLMWAASAGNEHHLVLIVDWATKTGKAVELFAQKDAEGRNALMHAIIRGKVNFANELLHAASKISAEALHDQLAVRAADGTTALTSAVVAVDATNFVCVLLRWMDDAMAEKMLGMVDAEDRTALAVAVLHNRLPVVRALVEGRPLKPEPTKVVCPATAMAGDIVQAVVAYKRSLGGAPTFHIAWQSSAVLRLGSHQLQNVIKLTIPTGVGPGVSFDVVWGGADFGPCSPGLAGNFAGTGAAARTTHSVLSQQDARKRSLLHCCVAPLPFGSYENVEMLDLLLKAGVPVGMKDAEARTAVDIARGQRSGLMLKRLQEHSVPVIASSDVAAPLPSVDVPALVDVESDYVAALAAAEKGVEEARKKDGLEPRPVPVEPNFQAPSKNSRIAVADGPDGQPLDLVMTKVDVSAGPYGQNVFYRMQVLHEQNQNNFLLFTRWGRIGEKGQFQTTPFETLEKATADFCKIFKSKSANEWMERANFVKKPLKYQMHEIKYSANVEATDALQKRDRKPLPALVTPVSFQRLLLAASDRDLLAHVLKSASVDRPLGLLKRQSLAEAIDLLEKIKCLVQKSDMERKKTDTSGERLQELHDKIAAASSRIYEICPTCNFRSESVPPIDTMSRVKSWEAKLFNADYVASAAKLLLAAQTNIAIMNPVDYLYKALGANITPLPEDSLELQLLEQYICRSSPKQCCLFSGPGAQPLPERKVEEKVDDFPSWQCVCDAQCFSSSACEKALPLVAPAGCTYKGLKSEGVGICIKQKYEHATTKGRVTYEEVWVRPKAADGSAALVLLTERQVASQVAAIYRVGNWEEQNGAGSTLLFHGSGLANTLAILHQGLRVQPPGVVQHGSAFGSGIYFANSFVKSRGYCSFSQGVGFMLLCGVDLGKELASKGFCFASTVMSARIASFKKQRGISADVKPTEHPELKKFCKELEEESFENLTQTEFDSFHYHSGGGPDSSGNVVHPGGFVVPCGEIVNSDGAIVDGSNARDEFIVYESQRVQTRYVIELRDRSPTFPLRTCNLPGDVEKEEEGEVEDRGHEDENDDDDDEEEEDEDDSE